MAKAPDKQTTPKVATKASKVLKDPKATPEAKSVAASDLSQTNAPAKETSPEVATKASKALKDPATPKAEKAVAASDLAQAAVKKKKK